MTENTNNNSPNHNENSDSNDNILRSNNNNNDNNTGPVAEDDEHSSSSSKRKELVYYFAIGSMMNPVSMANRGIQPVHSEPAELLDYRIEFFSSMGFADAVPEPGASLHGVLHLISSQDMKLLDEIEHFYARHSATARLYNGSLQTQVYVYSREDRSSGDVSKPAERYLDVLVEGAKHHRVKPWYIEWLRQHDKYPRPKRSEYMTWETPSELPVALKRDLELNNGKNDRPLWITVNGKVLEANFRCTEELDWFLERFQCYGRNMELHFGRILYDPKFGAIKSQADVTPVYAAWCEHFFVKYMKMRNQQSCWKVVATLGDC